MLFNIFFSIVQHFKVVLVKYYEWLFILNEWLFGLRYKIWRNKNVFAVILILEIPHILKVKLLLKCLVKSNTNSYPKTLPKLN